MQQSNSAQRSEEWFEARRGKFTSSRIKDLMGIKGLGKTGETYAFEMAAEFVMGKDPDDDFVSYDMQRGIDLEPVAFEHFKARMELEFKTVECCSFFELNEYTGGSPDGIVAGTDPLDIKCPKRTKFLKLVADDIIDPDYIDQLQHQMFITKANQAYFYNFYVDKGNPMGHLIIVKRDEARITLMKERLKEAIELREKFIKILQTKLNIK